MIVYFTTPVGRVCILKDKICAVAEDEKHGVNETVIRTRVYVDNDSEPFNILEDFDTVCEELYPNDTQAIEFPKTRDA